MNRLNPIYILALVLTLLVITFVVVDNKKSEFKSTYINYKNINLKAKDFSRYKQTWFNEKEILRKIDSIIKNSSFRNEKILKTQNSNIVRIKINSSNPRVLNKFINRVLNEKLLIKKLNIKKDSIFLEIGIK
ncbi:MAG: hypothetical protein GY932_14755 [Arcobacter sp.]|nr:hypothetical protein [Arcobacter sp.]